MGTLPGLKHWFFNIVQIALDNPRFKGILKKSVNVCRDKISQNSAKIFGGKCPIYQQIVKMLPLICDYFTSEGLFMSIYIAK